MTFGESTTFMKGVTSPDKEARRVLDAAVDAGINLVDTANVYSEGRSKELTGEWIRDKSIDNERNWKILDAVTAVARRREATPAAVSLAWLLARPEVSSAIVGAREPW